MTAHTQVNNRRKFPRFEPRKEMYVLHYNFGKIIDIGMGGVLFNYVDKDYLNDGPPEKGILFGHNDHYMDEIPFNTISDTIISKSTSSKPVIRQRRILFGKLTDSQVRMLERFIIDHARIPQMGFDKSDDFFPEPDYKLTM